MNFIKFNKQVKDNFDTLSKGQLFVVPIDRDVIFERYLDGFPDAETRQHHNCNCCKSFLRQYAGVVGVVNNKMVSIWDGIENDEYQTVVDNLKNYIHSLEISDVFLTDSPNCGTAKTYDRKRDINWDHFYVKAPSKFVSNRADTVRGERRGSRDVFLRSLEELSQDAVETVLELIAQNSLYRGEEHKKNLQDFLKLKKKYSKLSKRERKNFVWVESDTNPAVSRIRNTAIGTLLVDLSAGMDLDGAVSRYERIVAPTNYKRPTALVTPRMVEDAKKTIQELGLQDALERRYAESRDVNVENILFFHKPSAVRDVFDVVSKETTVDPRTLSKVETVTIEDFIQKVLPTTKSVEVLFENHQLNNMVSLITSDCQDKLFKWDNPFAWYYTGGITDSIKERVKSAGGCVEGKLRASLSWNNYDDLDIHCHEAGGTHIYFRNKQSYKSDGFLDVDMNAGYGKTREPVENIIWRKRVPNGKYTISVHNYCAREKTGQGYTVQIEFNGELFEFQYDKNPNDGGYGEKIEFTIKNDEIVFSDGTTSKPVVKTKWGINTNTFHKVKIMTVSPNFWGGNQIGNKHYFFFLDGVKNDETPRSIFNEFLRNDLDKHRKVFEIVGSKLTVADSDEQLSGLGFSSTVRNHVYVRVEGKFKRMLKVTF